MYRLEFHNIEAVWEDAVRFTFEEVFCFVGGNVADGGKDIGGMGAGTFDAITMVDPSFAGLVIDVKVLKIVVKVDGAGAEVSPEESGVGGKDGGDVDATFSAEGQGNTC